MMKFNKIIAVTLLAAVMVLTLNGCVAVSFSDSFGEMESIDGKGGMVKTEYPVAKFHSVRVDIDAAVIYKSAPEPSISIEIQENLTDLLDVSVQNDQLVIKSTKYFNISDSNRAMIYLSAPSLDTLWFSGMVEFRDSDPLVSDSLRLQIDGSLDGKLEIDTEKLDLRLDGIGNVNLSGRAPKTDLSIDGAGTINALDLETKDSAVTLDGACDISLSCSDTLDIEINGTGMIKYRGNPSLSQEISGMGTIRQVD